MVKDFQQLSSEHQKLREGIADITLAWAELENALVRLLAAILMNDPSASMASTMFFSINNLDGRLRLVDAAFTAFTTRSRREAGVKDDILAKWGTLQQALKHLRRTRNKVAHGQILTIYAGGENHARLTSPMFDFDRHASSFSAKQLPGMSANDLSTSVDAVNRARSKIDKFAKVVGFIVTGNSSSLSETLAELEDRPQSDPDNLDNQTPSTP